MTAEARDDGGDDRPGSDGPLRAFLQGDNVWVLIPLAALSIPILAVAGQGPIGWFVGAVMVLAALTASVRYLLGVRHRQALDEIEAKQRLAVAERDRLDAIDRMVDQPRTVEPREPFRLRPDDPGPARQDPPVP